MWDRSEIVRAQKRGKESEYFSPVKSPSISQSDYFGLPIIRTRKYAGWAYKEVLNFEEYFSSYIDNINDLTPSNISHFRASPTYVPSADSFNDQDHFDEFLQRSQTNPRIISV